MAGILQPTRNRVKVLVNGSLDAGDTSITLIGGGSTLPDTTTEGEFRLVLFNGSGNTDPSNDPNCEDVVVKGIAGDVLTVDPLQFDHNDPGAQYVMYLTWDKVDIDTVDDFLRDMGRSITDIQFNSNGDVTKVITAVREYTIEMRAQGGLDTITTNDSPARVLTAVYNEDDRITSFTYA